MNASVCYCNYFVGERVSTSPSMSASELQEDTKETGNSTDIRAKANMFGEGEDAIEFNEDYGGWTKLSVPFLCSVIYAVSLPNSFIHHVF